MPVKVARKIILGIRSGMFYGEAMEPIEAGSEVLARDAFGQLLHRRAVSGVETIDHHQVVWLCSEEEWLTAESEGRDPERFGWPAGRHLCVAPRWARAFY